MKEDFDDIDFKQLFKEKAHEPGENRWLTPRVLNRLPEKDDAKGVVPAEKWVYAIGLVLCAICWTALFATGFFDVITVRSLIYIIALGIGSFMLTIQIVRSALTL